MNMRWVRGFLNSTCWKSFHRIMAIERVKMYSTPTPTRRRIEGKKTSRGSSGMLSQSVGIVAHSDLPLVCCCFALLLGLLLG